MHLISTVALLVAVYSPSTIVLPETVIVGEVHAKRAWVCGDVQPNAIGGSQRTCEWQTR